MAKKSKNKNEYDVIIVGGGPGGSSAALFLAKKGYDVLLLDKAKFPRDKVCGDGISGKSVRLLNELGLLEKIDKVPHGPGRGVILSSPKGVELEVAIPEGEKGGYVCRRIDFDNVLFQEAKKKVDAKEGYSVFDLIWEDDKVVGVKARNEKGKIEEFRAKIVVGADGAVSIVANKLGRSKVDPEHSVVAVRAYYDNVEGLRDKIEIHFIDEVLPGYFWIFPLEGKKANVGVGMLLKDQRNKKIDLKKAMLDAMNSKKFKERFKDAKQLTPILGWSLPLGSKRKKPYANGVLLVGDAASLIDPFSGEGIGNALYSGKLASIAIDKAFKENDFSEKTLSYYDELLKEHLDEELQTMYKMQRLGRHKFLLNLIFDKASRNKELRELISSTLVEDNSKEKKKIYLSPMFWLKVIFS